MPGVADMKRAVQELMTAKVKVVAAHDLVQVMQNATVENANVREVMACLDHVTELPDGFGHAAPGWLAVATKQLLSQDRWVNGVVVVYFKIVHYKFHGLLLVEVAW